MISENEFKIMLQRGKLQKDVLEKEIESDCTHILSLDGWRSLKTDPVSDPKRGKGFGEKSMADYLYIRYGMVRSDPRWAEVLWIEWKRPKGGVLSQGQKNWHAEERRRGGLTWIAGEDFPPTVEGFMDFYRKSGLSRFRGVA